MARKQPLTLEEHRRLGAELKAIHDRLRRVAVLLSARYGLRITKQSDKVEVNLTLLRSLLDDRVFAENASLDTKDLRRIYYPGDRGNTCPICDKPFTAKEMEQQKRLEDEVQFCMTMVCEKCAYAVELE